MNQSQPPKGPLSPAPHDAELDNAFEPTTELNAAQLRAHLEAFDAPSDPQGDSDAPASQPPRREAALLEFDPDEATAFAPPRPKPPSFGDLDPLPVQGLHRPPVGTLGVASASTPQAASGRWRVHEPPAPHAEREPTVDRAWGDLANEPPSILGRVPAQVRQEPTSWAADIEREAAAVEAEFHRAQHRTKAPSDHHPTAHLPPYHSPAREDLLPIPVEPASSPRSHQEAHSDEDEVEVFTHTHAKPSPHRAAPTSSPGYFGLDRSARERALAHLTDDDPFQEAPTLEYEGPRTFEPARPAPQHADPLALMRPSHPAPASLERLTVFPLQAAPDKAHLLVPNDPDSEVASKYRMLDFKLKMIGESRPTRTIALTSPQAGSGTSLTALNLALTRAESPHTRVVVVDLNFHAPSLAQQVGVVPQATLPDLLAHRASLDQVLLRMQDSQCYLLPSKPVPEQAARFYKSTELTQLFGQLYDLFDLVVMDLPPILPHADINQINALIDVIVLVVAAGRTQGPSLRQATQMIDQEKIVGVILNDFVPNA